MDGAPNHPAQTASIEAVEAQRRRIAADIAVMRRDGLDPEALNVCKWARASSVSIEGAAPASPDGAAPRRR